MPALFWILIVRLIAEIVKAMRQRNASKLRPLCTDCAHAHVRYAVNGRREIACTLAGAVRPVQIEVMYCTDYRDRNAAQRLVPIGFARPIGTPEPNLEVASFKTEISRFGNAMESRYGYLISVTGRSDAAGPFDWDGPVRLEREKQIAGGEDPGSFLLRGRGCNSGHGCHGREMPSMSQRGIVSRSRQSIRAYTVTAHSSASFSPPTDDRRPTTEDRRPSHDWRPTWPV